MPGVAVYFVALYVIEEQRLEQLAEMRADDDGMLERKWPAAPDQRYAEALARSRRDTKHWLTIHVLDGWTPEQHRHWVNTGEEP